MWEYEGVRVWECEGVGVWGCGGVEMSMHSTVQWRREGVVA